MQFHLLWIGLKFSYRSHTFFLCYEKLILIYMFQLRASLIHHTNDISHNYWNLTNKSITGTAIKMTTFACNHMVKLRAQHPIDLFFWICFSLAIYQSLVAVVFVSGWLLFSILQYLYSASSVSSPLYITPPLYPLIFLFIFFFNFPCSLFS